MSKEGGNASCCLPGCCSSTPRNQVVPLNTNTLELELETLETNLKDNTKKL